MGGKKKKQVVVRTACLLDSHISFKYLFVKF